MFIRFINVALGRPRNAISKVARPKSFRPVLEGLEDRWTPAKYEWHGTATGGATINIWSYPFNWLVYDATQNAYIQQTPGTASYPGAASGDTAVFNGAHNDTNCYQDVVGGVTIDNMQVIGGAKPFSKSIILSNPLTISGTANPTSTLSLSSGYASIRGSAPGQPAFRGTLNLAGKSTFAWNAGIIENLTVNVTKTATTVATLAVSASTFGVRSMGGSDINVDGILHWYSGNVGVYNSPTSVANSNININTGTFLIDAADATWGATASDVSYFKINNSDYGVVRLNASGVATLNGDYITQGVTELDVGILKLGGKAEQGFNGGGEFMIRGNTTVELAGTDHALSIYDGTIDGNGRVDGNLILGYDPNRYPDKIGGGMLTAGYLAFDPNVGHEVYVPGTLTVTQSFQMFGDYSSIDTEITDAGMGQLVVTGTATLTSKLSVEVDTELGTGTYTVISAGAVQGQFSSVFMPTGNDDPNNPLEYDLEYSGTSVYVDVQPVP